ncbi:hypothetical protein D4R89_12830 [bacterium]|nr:MAG: hypothetical protein D4R89_12830 [bacterium]
MGAPFVKKTIRWFICGFLLAGALAGLAEASSIIMPLVQVKAGMKGRGKSVFEADRIEEFDAEILGVLENFQPRRNLILARLRGRGLETTGVIEGMSGSPVYIDGKLIGAVAFSFPFSKEPIAGITPIEEMLAVQPAPAGQGPGDAVPIPVQRDLTPEELLGLYRSAISPKLAAMSAASSAIPLSVPVIFSGFSSAAFENAKPFFAGLGLQPTRAGSAGQSMEKPALSVLPLQEGDAVGVQLMGGDLDMTAVGTVTYVDAGKVLAFGHPLYNLGAVDFAMTRASVITVVSGLQSSFKIAATGPMVGRITQDRTVGAYGELGKAPKLIPVNVKLEGGPFAKKEFKFRIVNDKILSPALINMALSSIITSEERAYGNLSLEFDGDIYMDKGLSVHLEDLFSGNYNNAGTSLSGIFAAAVYFLTNNEFKDVGIYRIDLNIRAVEEARLCSLEKVLLDKYEASPGERIQVKVTYRTLKEESLVEEISIMTPDLPGGSEFTLFVGDAAAMQQIERSQYRTQDFVPRNLNQLIRMLGNLRKNNRIYFKILAAKPGLFLRGEEMPNLPPTLKSMFSSPRASASFPTELTRSTLSEYQMPVPYVFRGGAAIPIKIRK